MPLFFPLLFLPLLAFSDSDADLANIAYYAEIISQNTTYIAADTDDIDAMLGQISSDVSSLSYNQYFTRLDVSSILDILRDSGLSNKVNSVEFDDSDYLDPFHNTEEFTEAVDGWFPSFSDRARTMQRQWEPITNSISFISHEIRVISDPIFTSSNAVSSSRDADAISDVLLISVPLPSLASETSSDSSGSSGSSGSSSSSGFSLEWSTHEFVITNPRIDRMIRRLIRLVSHLLLAFGFVVIVQREICYYASLGSVSSEA